MSTFYLLLRLCIIMQNELNMDLIKKIKAV